MAHGLHVQQTRIVPFEKENFQGYLAQSIHVSLKENIQYLLG